MSKMLTYLGFVILCAAVILGFTTARTYTQLAAPVLLYPLLAYLALRMFPRRAPTPKAELKIVETVKADEELSEDDATIADNDKRELLKMIGVAGVSFFLYTLLNRRSETAFFGRINGPAVTALEDASGKKINPATDQPLDGFTISDIDDRDAYIAYLGFIKIDGSWYITEQNSENGSFRYVKGTSNYASSWSNRRNLNYGLYQNVFK